MKRRWQKARDVPRGYRIEVKPIQTMLRTWRYQRTIWRDGKELALGCEAETFTDTSEEGIEAATREAWNDVRARRESSRPQGSTHIEGVSELAASNA